MPNRIGNLINRVTRRDNNQDVQNNNNRRGVRPPQADANLAQGAGRIARAGAQQLQQGYVRNGLYFGPTNVEHNFIVEPWRGISIQEALELRQHAHAGEINLPAAVLVDLDRLAERHPNQVPPAANAQRPAAQNANANQQRAMPNANAQPNNQRNLAAIAAENRRNQGQAMPQHQNHQAQAARQNGNNQAYVPRRERHSDPVQLRMLRIGNEQDHELVTIPDGRRVRQMQLAQPNPHEATDHLQGHEYLQAVIEDPHLGENFVAWVMSHHVMGADFSPEELEGMVDRIRMIASAQRANPETADLIDELAYSANSKCADGNNYFVNAMWGHAYNHHLAKSLNSSSNKKFGVELFNVGAAFFRLERLQAAVSRRLNPECRQTVHTMLDAEYRLQDELDLPTRHTGHFYTANGQWEETWRNELIEEVRADLTRNDFHDFFNFMSNWTPWQAYMEKQPNINEQKKKAEAYSANAYANLERNRENPESPIYHLAEHEYLERARRTSRALDDYPRVVVAQATWQYLMNYRANILDDSDQLLDKEFFQ